MMSTEVGMVRFVILEAPSVLGLTPSGVECLPGALLDAGLLESLAARHAGSVAARSYSSERDPASRMLNPEGIRDYAISLADSIERLLANDEFPVVLGGDCSILLGVLLALRRRGRYGLMFLDGHTDFYRPDESPTGQAADMDLALATGRGPAIVTNLQGWSPLVRDEDVVAMGYRDAGDVADDGSSSLEGTEILGIELEQIRRLGVERVMGLALARLTRSELSGFWVHLDVDVLDDALMPAVDYRMPGGLSFEELGGLLSLAMRSGSVVGLHVTIFNPSLDEKGTCAGTLTSCLSSALARRS